LWTCFRIDQRFQPPNGSKRIPRLRLSAATAPGYAAGARAGAPQARQVADRFHLLQNFREAVERLLGQFGAPIREAPIGKARREGAVLGATDEAAPRHSTPQGLAQRCKRSDAFD